MKIFITRVLPEAMLKPLTERGYELTFWRERRNLTPAELIAHCKKHDALISIGGNKIDRHFLENCPQLKVIALHSVGFDHVDIETATRLKIPVGNTPGVLSNATADTAFLLMIAVSRKAFYLHRKIVHGDWNFFDPMADLGIELYGKRIGIFGLGKIGIEMARKCRAAYNMQVVYHNRNRNLEAEEALGATYVSFDDLLAASDVLSVHASLGKETRGLFSLAQFKRMKPDAIFINTARGSIHNEPDLQMALEQRMIWGAGLDVTDPEPMHKNSPLLMMPNVAVLPHIGSATQETRSKMVALVVDNVLAGLEGRRLPNVVNAAIYG